MSSTTLADARRRFASELQRLRRKQLGIFESSLDAAVAKAGRSEGKKISEKFLLIREQFGDEFINSTAPPIVEALNPDSKQDILRQLRQFQAQGAEPPSFDPAPHYEETWRPGMPRIILGAAIGAAVALLWLALQTGGTNSPPIRQNLELRQPPAAETKLDTPAAATPGETAQTPGEAPNARSAAPAESPPALRVQPTVEHTPFVTVEEVAFRIIIGALGAALGAFAILGPPVRLLLARLRLFRNFLGLFATLGFSFLFLRRVAFAATIAAAGCAIAALTGLMFAGPKPGWALLLSLAGILIIIALRSSSPSGQAMRSSATRAAAVEALENQLTLDANLWGALAAGLTLRPAAVLRTNPQLDEVRSVILARRARMEPAEDILRIVEQQLGLAAARETESDQPSEFLWKIEHSDQYDTVGIVAAGDSVTVLTAPRTGVDARGVKTVFQKGQVMRKVKGN